MKTFLIKPLSEETETDLRQMLTKTIELLEIIRTDQEKIIEEINKRIEEGKQKNEQNKR